MYFSFACALCFAALIGINGKVAQREEREGGVVKRELNCEMDRRMGFLCRTNPDDYPLFDPIINPSSANRYRDPMAYFYEAAREAGPRSLCNEVGRFIDCQQTNFDEALEQCTFDGAEAIGYAVGRRVLKRVESEVNKICRGEFGDFDGSLKCLANLDVWTWSDIRCHPQRLMSNKKERFEAAVECVKNVMDEYDDCGPEALQFAETLLNHFYDIYEKIKDNRLTGLTSLNALNWLL